MRFQKRIKLLPGVRLNLSKSGISASIGRPGATMNIGSKGAKITGGIPGTGLSHTEQLSTKRRIRPIEESVEPLDEDPRAHETAIGIVIFVCVLVGLAWLLSKA